MKQTHKLYKLNYNKIHLTLHKYKMYHTIIRFLQNILLHLSWFLIIVHRDKSFQGEQ